ncbi:hypothetical protein HPC49_20835 [Pyxidicoccus fallax]|uniref:Uncharacterized protein n=1 Tax=Pyxidicoccus fallax TaxID=394095 RepID=A0A848LQS9_9BACT|nr:hypothetical protein [Pyxidicoccus fallax]NMO20029.1 hypothetical protein [Pyxidicoccus fallax]NPC80659.1 hypothetical protein [Pyxidicoccus fallax]
MRPPYFDNSLLELGTGLHFTTPAPPDVADLRHLASNDPWRVLPCILANLQQGRFDVSGRLVKLMHEVRDADVWNACATLLSYAAPYSVIRELEASSERLLAPRHSPYTRRYFCEILSCSAGVWGMPHLIHHYRQLKDRKVEAEVEYYISQVLEVEPGPIAKGPRVLWESNGLPPPFEESAPVLLVEEYLVLLQNTFQGLVSSQRLHEQEALIEGGRLDIRGIAQRLLKRIHTGEHLDRIAMGRMLLEATTGLDCRAFFDESGRLQNLTAAAIVEDFLERGDADRYQPGVRYFFGHRIPD